MKSYHWRVSVTSTLVNAFKNINNNVNIFCNHFNNSLSKINELIFRVIVEKGNNWCYNDVLGKVS